MKQRSYPFLLISSAVFILSVLAVIPGCRLFRRSDLRELMLPDTGDSDLLEHSITGWEVAWLSSDGSVRVRSLEKGRTFSVSLPRELPVIVTATPIIGSGSFRLHPAGCALAIGGDGDEPVGLTWIDGFAADYFLGLAAAGIDPSRINIRRFRETARVRSGGNPWHLDVRRLSTDLVAGSLWTYSFRRMDLHDIEVRFPPGRWYGMWPPDGYVTAVGGTFSLELPAGIHSFLHYPGGEIRMISVDEDGRFTSIQRSGAVAGQPPVDGLQSLFLQPAVHSGEGPASEESPGGG